MHCRRCSGMCGEKSATFKRSHHSHVNGNSLQTIRTSKYKTDCVTKTDFKCNRSHGAILKQFSSSETDCKCVTNHKCVYRPPGCRRVRFVAGHEVIRDKYAESKLSCSDESSSSEESSSEEEIRSDKHRSSEKWLKELQSFRETNWFDCHAEASHGSKLIDRVRKPTSDDHEYKFLLDERLCLIPVTSSSKYCSGSRHLFPPNSECDRVHNLKKHATSRAEMTRKGACQSKFLTYKTDTRKSNDLRYQMDSGKILSVRKATSNSVKHFTYMPNSMALRHQRIERQPFD